MTSFIALVATTGVLLLAGWFALSRYVFERRTLTCPGTGQEVTAALSFRKSAPWSTQFRHVDVVQCSRFTPCTDVECDKACKLTVQLGG